MYNKNYLSKRPFLIVNTTFTPGPGARTAQKDWAEKAGWNVIEDIAIVDRVTNKHQTYATLIVDILEAKCVKNGFTNVTREEAMAHFMQKYKEEIKQAMAVWLEREAHKRAATSLQDLLKQMTPENQHALVLDDTVGAEVTAEEATAEAAPVVAEEAADKAAE